MEELKSRAELEQIVKDINGTLGLKQMHIEMSSDARSEALADFLVVHFFPDETLTKSIGLVVDEQWKPMLQQQFTSNLSLLLIDDVTDEIIGVRTMVLLRKDESDPLVEEVKRENEKVRIVFALLDYLAKEMDVFRYYGVDVVVHFLNLGVHKDYRNKGLASKLMDAALLYTKQIGLDTPCITVEATSIYSQKIFDKRGFEALKTVNYDEFKVDEEIVFKNTGESKSIVLYVKKL